MFVIPVVNNLILAIFISFFVAQGFASHFAAPNTAYCFIADLIKNLHQGRGQISCQNRKWMSQN